MLNPKEFSPMLACPVDMDKIDRYAHYTMEVKLDGVRCVAIKDGSTVTLWSRQGKELTYKLRHLREQLLCIRGDFVLDGEIGYVRTERENIFDENIIYDMDFNATMRVIGSDPDEAERKHQNNIVAGMGKIQYVVFDIMHKGNYPAYRLRQEDRRKGLRDLLETLAPAAVEDVKLSASFNGWTEGFYQKVVKEGGEGVIIKNPDAAYQFGKRRANTWYKVKKYESVDGVIIGFKLGTGKYEHQIGALHVELPDGAHVYVSGMADAERAHMTQNFSTGYLGKHVEIRHFGKIGQAKDGYRHPQFLRMRPDLDT